MRPSVTTPELLRAFTPPPELTSSPPREVRLTAAGRAVIVLSWLLAASAIAAGILLHAEVRRQSDTARALEDRGRTTEAVVDRLWRKKSDGKPAFAALHFDVDGRRVAAEQRMQLTAWQDLRIGSRVAVRYLPENPTTFVLAGARDRQMPAFVPYLASGALALISILCAAAVRSQRWLLAEGRPAPAVVTALHKHQSSHGGTHRSIRYEFPLLGGGVATGKAAVSRNAAPVGATICIVYDPDRPGRSRPYPFALVTPDRG